MSSYNRLHLSSLVPRGEAEAPLPLGPGRTASFAVDRPRCDQVSEILKGSPQSPCSSACASRARRASSSRQVDPPGPFDPNAAWPPARQRRRHTYTALVDTRSRRAISATGTSSANHWAACNRTASRLALPWADKPPPSAYLTHTEIGDLSSRVTTTHRSTLTFQDL
jgi:hypothetical protein